MVKHSILRTHTLPWAPAEGEGCESARIVVLPPSGKSNTFYLLYGWLFSYFFFVWAGPFCYVFLFMWGPFHHVRDFLLPFSPCGDLFCYVFLLMGGWSFSPCEGLFATFYSMWGAFYWRAPMHITYIIILSC